jgi:hypothetical protein
VNELVVGAGGENLRVTILELAVEVREAFDLRRANESEIFRVKEKHLPFSLEGLVGDILERGFWVAGNDAFQFKAGKFFAYA